MYPAKDARELANLLRISRELDVVGDVTATVDNPSDLLAWALVLSRPDVLAWRAEDSGHRYLHVTAHRSRAPIRGQVTAVLACEQHLEYWDALGLSGLGVGDRRVLGVGDLSSAWVVKPIPTTTSTGPVPDGPIAIRECELAQSAIAPSTSSAAPPVDPANLAGRFSYDAPTGKWDWDDEVFRIHGYEPGSIQPTTQLVLDSKHPDDRARVEALLDRVTSYGGSFSISYRLIGGDGKERRVVVVGEGTTDTPGSRIRVDGYYIDLTADFAHHSEEYAAAAVAASAENRAVIEQAKGVLMLCYGLDDDQAFAMLAWWSRNRNVRVRDLAARLVQQTRSGEVSDTELRQTIDALLHDIAINRR